MRTSIDIDAELLAAAMAASDLSTKRATVERGLRLLVRLHGQVEALADMEGLGWEGDLDNGIPQCLRGTPPLEKIGFNAEVAEVAQRARRRAAALLASAYSAQPPRPPR